jgi:2-polyprenyl-6-methoxyphenol hydroxylase-like FAD-dependent oxidoreductase
MTENPSDHSDVIVVGTGPTGLLLAGDLAAAGVATTILERRGDAESNLTRAFGVHARTLEELDARGLGDELAAQGAHLDDLRLFENVQIHLQDLPSRYPYLLITPQYNTEGVLKRRAQEQGVRIVTSATVTGLHQDKNGVDVEVRLADGDTTQHRAVYVVGADGVHSTIRYALGLPYTGRAVLKSIMLADVKLARPLADTLTVNGVGDCFAFIAPFGDGWYRVFAWDRNKQVPDDAPLEFDEVLDVALRALGDDYGMHEPRWMTRFHSDERQVPQYRVGRVFLAGDAAHCHSPAGGQGMNTGLQDAANLSWKLAAAVKGWAPDRLLDSYHAERHPVGKQVVRSSGAIIRMAMLRSALGRAIRSAVGSRLLRVPPIAHRVTGMLSGIGIAYPAPRGAHPTAGRRIGDVPLADGSRLYEALRSGRFVLLSETPYAAAEYASRLEVVTPQQAMPTTLVRPDGYVAWATDETDPVRRDADLRTAFTDWLGSVTEDESGTL